MNTYFIMSFRSPVCRQFRDYVFLQQKQIITDVLIGANYRCINWDREKHFQNQQNIFIRMKNTIDYLIFPYYYHFLQKTIHKKTIYSTPYLEDFRHVP